MARPVRKATGTAAPTKALPAVRVTKKPAPKAPGGKKLKTAAEPKAVASKLPTPPTVEKEAPSKKRKAIDEEPSKPTQPAKRVKAVATLNSPPEQILDIYVCGDGESGELGLGAKAIDGKKPTGIQRPRLNKLLDASKVGVVQISAGGMHCVSLTHDQKILTWGVNDNGALGRDTAWEAPLKDMDQESNSDDSDSEDGDLNPLESTPIAVPTEDFGKNAPTFVQVVASSSATFALTSEGTVWGWGTFRANDGILGFFTDDAIEGAKKKNPEKQQQRKPVLVPFLKKIVSLAAGSDHILALDDKGKVFAWGTGEQSQLGRKVMERTRYQALTPSRVALPKIKQIACGGYHSFAIDEKGLVHAWGANNFGQTGLTDGIGEGDAVVLKPGVIEELRPYKIRHIQGGLHHSIACTEDGKLLVWGRCDDGQAGINLDTLPKEKFEYDERGRPRILKFAEVPGINAVSVAAGIDNCFAISEDGKAYSWGFSANYRTCQGTDDTIKEATMVGKGGVKLSHAYCGGQFSVLVGPAKDL